MRLLLLAVVLCFARASLAEPIHELRLSFDRPPAENKPVLVLSLANSGEASLGGTVVKPGGLEAILKASVQVKIDGVLALNIDSEVPYARVLEVLELVHAAGIARVVLLKQRAEAPPLPKRLKP